MNVAVSAVGRTHVGRVRRRNEDAFYVGTHLVAIADGMGGHPGGDVASATVVDALRTFDIEVPAGELVDTLARAVQATNAAVGTKAAEDRALARMGSTLVALLWSGSTAAL